ncbi:thioredoxin-disulfide reductase [Candidatus Curtissbacteria bacterium]|nr:thioredoxin-disulfide reductase [Candidatus Curtissbacteria bacterium]
MNVSDVVIIGSGPAGLTAAIYTSRALLTTVVVSGETPGGQLMITSEVENFPGFDEGIMGPELMDKMKKQAEKFGTEFVAGNVTRVDLNGEIKKLWVGEVEIQAKSVIVATGSNAKWLGIPSEEKYWGKGVSACATCDGFFFRNKEIAVVGGGDSAMEEATFLTKFASKVTIIHRSDEFRASKIMLEKAKNNPKIEFLTNKTVSEVMGGEMLSELKLVDTNTKEESELKVEGLFVAIGHAPNTGIFQGQLEINEKGYLVVTDYVNSSIKGVFIAGDVSDYRYRQAITASGAGCMAALEAGKFLTGE